MTIEQLVAVPLVDASAAEQALAGCAAVSRDAADMAMRRVTMADFHDPRCWEVIVAGAHLDNGPDLDDRIDGVAAFAEIEPAELHRWVNTRPCYADKSGGLAAQVRCAAERRRSVAALVEQLVAAGARLVPSR